MVNLQTVSNIAILIFPDVEELDFVGVYEVLCKSTGMREEGSLALDRALHVEIIARESPVLCRNGLKVVPHKISSDFGAYDVLIIPGGRGIEPLMKDTEFLQSVHRFAQDHLVCSVCTGSLLLAAAGLLRGKRALTHHEHIAELEAFAEATVGRVHVDRNVITSAGISCSIDLGLELLTLFYNKETALKVADRLEFLWVTD